MVASSPVVLRDLLVVDFTRYLPGPFASRELLGSAHGSCGWSPRTAIRCARSLPAGTPRSTQARNRSCGTSSDHPGLGPALAARADVVLEGFRPGVADRLGIGAAALPESVVYCSVTGFGAENLRAGHDLNYAGWAGLLADTAPALPPVQVADIAGGSLFAVIEILAALLERGRTGRGKHLIVSMTHNAHRLAAHRLRGEPERTLTGGLACYRMYETGRRPLPHGDCGRAEVLATPLRADRSPRARRAPLRAGSGRARHASSTAVFLSRPLVGVARPLRRRGRDGGPGRDARRGAEWLGERCHRQRARARRAHGALAGRPASFEG